ncbi:MAG: hypothetical protein PHC70_01045 [Patescibacteria group bacterium]|nr:hypothetical protein [Patescibacteria group bacterium]
MRRLIGLLMVSCAAFLFLSATPAEANVVALNCEPNLGKCAPSQGASVCPSGMNLVAPPAPDVDETGMTEYTLKCSNPGWICCKGTISGKTGGSAEETKGLCPANQSYTKAGLGNVPCGANQCRAQGFLYFTDCLSENDCAANRGATDGGNMAGCGEGTFCCRMKKNRCNDASTDPNKIYLCTSETSCTAKGGKSIGKGFGCSGQDYPTCCEFSDSMETPMLNAGEPFKGLGGAMGGSQTQVNIRARKYQNINSFCFTEMECAQASGPKAWVKGNGCPNKGNTQQGYCKAPPPVYDLQYPLGGVKTIGDLANFIGLIFNYAMGIIIIVAAVIFVYGGLRYMFAAVSNDVEVGKTIMMDSVIGLLLGLGAYTIMANVNFNTVNLRPFDVFMINKLSFYDTYYCNDVKPAPGKTEAMFQDAGSPISPLDLNITKGYPLKLADTQCGKEYFIEGGDSLSICTGSKCNAGACLNCAAGGKNCQSGSEKEHVCFDNDLGGNLVLESKLTAEDVKGVLFCAYKSGSDTKIDTMELGKASFEGAVKSAGPTSGWIGRYAIKYRDKIDAIETFKTACMAKGAQNVLFTLNARFSGDESAFGKWMRRGSEVLPLTAAISFATGVSSLDETRFILSKDDCNKNILSDAVTVTAYKDSFAAGLSAYSSFEEAMAQTIIAPKSYWSADEIVNSLKTKQSIMCNFTVVGKQI